MTSSRDVIAYLRTRLEEMRKETPSAQGWPGLIGAIQEVERLITKLERVSGSQETRV